MSKYNVKLEDLKNLNIRLDIGNLLKLINAETICEIGVRDGVHLKHLMVPCVKQAFAVDIWKDTGLISENDERVSQDIIDSQLKLVLDMASNDSRIKIIKDFSVSAAQSFSDEYFDFVYIDADHTEDAVSKDILAWWTKVRKGGILAGHDYSPAIVTYPDNIVLKFGVIEAVNKFVKNNNLNLHVDTEQSWFIIKV